MKKFTLLVASAAVAISASAAVPALQRNVESANLLQNQRVQLEQAGPAKTRVVAEAANLAAPRSFLPATATIGGAYALMQEPADMLYMGISPERSGFGVGVAFGGWKGDITFKNYSINAEASQWAYGWADDAQDAPLTTTNATDLVLRRDLLNGVYQPELTIVDSADDTESAKAANLFYIFGYTPAIVAGGDANTCGATTYPCRSLQDENGYKASTIGWLAYSKEQANFGSNGLMEGNGQSWEYHLNRWGYEASNVQFGGFVMTYPKPVTPYVITTMWQWANVTATAETELECYIYALDEEGNWSEAPVAKGIAPINEGENEMLMFELYSVDADGDEVMDPIVIDSAIAIEIDTNRDITEYIPVFGNMTEMNMDAWDALDKDFIYTSHTDIILGFDSPEGSAVGLFGCPSYYYGSTDEMVFYPCDTYTMLDAVFPWAVPYECTNNADFDVKGGTQTLTYDSFFNIAMSIEEEIMTAEASDDWISFNVTPQYGENGGFNGLNDIEVTAEEYVGGTTMRKGFINFRGYGQDFAIVVTQGKELGISDIEVVEGAAEYFDLQGRRLTSAPAAGLYIERHGNHTAKVIK